VVTARAGVWTPKQFRGALAMVVANYDRNRPGTEWRTLEDTTNDAVIARRRLLPYRSWQMSEDDYSGVQLMWLAADAKIRELTHDKKSLDTFAQNFYGMDDGSYVTRTYTLDDVVNALHQVVKYDWRGSLDRNVYAPAPPLATEMEAAGWKLVYTDAENEYERPTTPRRNRSRFWSKTS
jgi:predicted metalloprotease with PDZ domain